MSVSPARRRHLYRIDAGIRASRVRQSRRARGSTTFVRYMRDSWSIIEMAEAIGCSPWTIRKYERLGIIPKPTYPCYYRRYWRHQAMLLIWLFESMRMEGWPSATPHFVGSAYWTLALTRLRTEWKREPYARETGRGDDHEDREDGAGEQDCAPAD